MITLRRILCPTNFSPISEYAICYARSLARRFGAELHLLNVVEQIAPPPFYPQYSEAWVDLNAKITEQADEKIIALADKFSSADLSIHHQIEGGSPFHQIIRYAREQAIDLIVMGTIIHSGLGQIIFGSTTEKVIRKSPCPVLTVKATPEVAESCQTLDVPISTVLVPTDFSDYSLYALKYGISIAQQFKASLCLYHVNDITYRLTLQEYTIATANLQIQEIGEYSCEFLKKIASDQVPKNVTAETVCEDGEPGSRIIQYAKAKNVSMIIMATHGRTGLKHALFGSVAEKVVRNCLNPVLTVRHPEHEFVMV